MVSAPDSARPPARPPACPAHGNAPRTADAEPDPAAATPLLVVVDPVARLTDGESVRIARDVLRAGSPGMKLRLADGVEDTARALARHGGRRPVLIGNDRALLRTVRFLHDERDLERTALAVVPVGNGPSVALARSLGLPLDAVAAARTVLRGGTRPLDLLVDDEGDVVLGGLRVERPAPPAAPAPSRQGTVPPGLPLRRLCHTLARTVLPQTAARGGRRPPEASARPEPAAHRLRVEADGALLAGPDRPLAELSVRADQGGGLAEVVARPAGDAVPLRARARRVTVTASGDGFRYRPDADGLAGPAVTRTWTLRPGAWHLVLPPDG